MKHSRNQRVSFGFQHWLIVAGFQITVSDITSGPQGSGEPVNVLDAEMLNRGLPPSVYVKADGERNLEINTEASVSRGIREPRVFQAYRYVEMCVLSKA